MLGESPVKLVCGLTSIILENEINWKNAKYLGLQVDFVQAVHPCKTNADIFPF